MQTIYKRKVKTLKKAACYRAFAGHKIDYSGGEQLLLAELGLLFCSNLEPFTFGVKK